MSATKFGARSDERNRVRRAFAEARPSGTIAVWQ
jgi:hypothetical protein